MVIPQDWLIHRLDLAKLLGCREVMGLDRADISNLAAKFADDANTRVLESLLGHKITQENKPKLKLLLSFSSKHDKLLKELNNPDIDPARSKKVNEEIAKIDKLYPNLLAGVCGKKDISAVKFAVPTDEKSLTNIVLDSSVKATVKTERKIDKLKTSICAYPKCGQKDSFKQSLKKCERCAPFMDIYYCSKEHQKLDWNSGHKGICGKPLKLPAAAIHSADELD